MTATKVIICDATSLTKCLQKVFIWNDIKSGAIIQVPDPGHQPYDPDERITYWSAQRDEYVKKLTGYGLEIVPTVAGFIALLIPVMPEIIAEFKKLFNIP